jgi:hypothetical protein
MNLSAITDDDLMSDINFCQSVMSEDSAIDDIQLEYANGDTTSYTELLVEAARRVERGGD